MCISKELYRLCVATNSSIAIAESCTSGLVASNITSISGSSDYFKGGVIVYQNDIKTKILGISKELMIKKTAVSFDVARQMAINVRERFDSTYSVATSGYAGPLGGDKYNPVGTVFVSVASPYKCSFKQFFFEGSRESIVDQAAKRSIEFLVEEIKKQVETLI